MDQIVRSPLYIFISRTLTILYPSTDVHQKVKSKVEEFYKMDRAEMLQHPGYLELTFTPLSSKAACKAVLLNQLDTLPYGKYFREVLYPWNNPSAV